MPGEYTFYAGSKLLEPIADSIGMSVDKVNLVASQLVSLPLAIWYYKRLPAGKTSKMVRLWYPLLIGLAMLFFCYGSAMKHLLANAGVCYILLLCSPTKYVHKLVFLFAMGYLSFIHLYRWWILTSYSIDITGPMMVLVQKATTLAFSLHDGKVKKREELNAIQKREAIPEVPSLLEYMSFMFHFQSVLCGPLCFFSDYIAFIDGCHVTPKSTAVRPKTNNNEDDMPTPWAAVTEKLMWCLVFLGISVVVTPHFEPEIMLQADMLRTNFFLWYLTLILVLMLQRVQYYFVWMLADVICNASGLGFAGYDENGKAKWDLVSNVNPYRCEMSTNFKDCLDAWNCTTMYWLRRVAYDRTPPQFRTVYTYLLSAWWHGFFPGYYLTFLTGALFTVAGRTVRRCLRHRFLDDSSKKLLYDIATFTATKVALAYCTYPFVTMQFLPGWTLYKHVYFFMHIFALIAIFGLPKVFPPPKRQQVDHESPSKPVKAD